MLNSHVVNPKVGPLSSHSCNCSDALWTIRHQVPKVHTHPSVASFATFFPVLQATTEHCGNLATRLRVSPLCHNTAFSTVRLALTNPNPNPNRPPSNFGAWAASTHGHLLGTIWYFISLGKLLHLCYCTGGMSDTNVSQLFSSLDNLYTYCMQDKGIKCL